MVYLIHTVFLIGYGQPPFCIFNLSHGLMIGLFFYLLSCQYCNPCKFLLLVLTSLSFLKWFWLHFKTKVWFIIPSLTYYFCVSPCCLHWRSSFFTLKTFLQTSDFVTTLSAIQNTLVSLSRQIPRNPNQVPLHMSLLVTFSEVNPLFSYQGYRKLSCPVSDFASRLLNGLTSAPFLFISVPLLMVLL